MKSTLKVTLRANEKIYVNGAVIRSDRKVSLEFLNDVHFLLESHVLQPEDATTPLRQLYFIVQVILMSPNEADDAKAMFRRSLPRLIETFSDETMRRDLQQIDRLVSEGHIFEGLKNLRGLFDREARILGAGDGEAEVIPMLAAGE